MIDNSPTQPAAQAGEVDELPEIGSVWQHTNGNRYTVLYIANEFTQNAVRYPKTVVYQGTVNGLVWARAACDWSRSMTPVEATQPAAQATPEPVGEPVFLVATGEIYEGEETYQRYEGSPPPLCDFEVLYTRTAPGVPEGLPAVLTDWGFDVHDDEDGRTWLTIRNDQDDVARLSVPTFWPASGRQTIGAVVLHQFSAALTSALAAAQAKGGEHE